MSEALDARAERLKLARLLSLKEDELTFLAGVSAADVREFRELATDRLFDSAPGLAVVGSAARLVPSGLAAKICSKAFGPMLVARVAGSADPGKAIDIASHLNADFLTEVAIHLDPRRVSKIISGIPDAMIGEVADRLGKQDEHVTMGRFLGFVGDGAIVAAIARLSDEAVLRTAFVLEDKGRLDDAVALLPAGRIPGVIKSAADLGLWPEALDLIDQMSDEQRATIASVVAELDVSVITSLVDTATKEHLWESLLPLIRVMSTEDRTYVANLPALHQPELIDELVRVGLTGELWAALAPLVDVVPVDVRQQIVATIAGLDAKAVDAVVAAAVGTATATTLNSLVQEARS